MNIKWKEYETAVRKTVKRKRSIRVLSVLCIALAAGAGAVYLYYHNPYSYPLPCMIYAFTGFYCPGCGAGRACYSILHGRIFDAFSYNPVMTVMLPLIGLYIAARLIDWAVTGGNHIDRKISIRMLTWILGIVLVYGVVRNIPVFPFTLLAPGGLAEFIR